MSPRDFHDQILAPNIADFKSDKADMRKAFNAVMSIDALAARIFYDPSFQAPPNVRLRDDTEYREHLATQHPDFRLVRDVAKGLKHFSLRGAPLVSGAASVSSRTTGYGDLPWGEGGYGGSPEVVVQLLNGKLRALTAVLDAAHDFLDREMRSHGL